MWKGGIIGQNSLGKDDWVETFITDNCITYFIRQNKHLMVDWFKGAYRVNITIPPPPTKGETK